MPAKEKQLFKKKIMVANGNVVSGRHGEWHGSCWRQLEEGASNLTGQAGGKRKENENGMKGRKLKNQ